MKKVADEDLQEIQKLRETLVEIISIIGELHLNKILITKQITDINTQVEIQEKRFVEFQEAERVLYETLQQKYGAGNINLETGEITE